MQRIYKWTIILWLVLLACHFGHPIKLQAQTDTIHNHFILLLDRSAAQIDRLRAIYYLRENLTARDYVARQTYIDMRLDDVAALLTTESPTSLKEMQKIATTINKESGEIEDLLTEIILFLKDLHSREMGKDHGLDKALVDGTLNQLVRKMDYKHLRAPVAAAIALHYLADWEVDIKPTSATNERRVYRSNHYALAQEQWRELLHPLRMGDLVMINRLVEQNNPFYALLSLELANELTADAISSRQNPVKEKSLEIIEHLATARAFHTMVAAFIRHDPIVWVDMLLLSVRDASPKLATAIDEALLQLEKNPHDAMSRIRAEAQNRSSVHRVSARNILERLHEIHSRGIAMPPDKGLAQPKRPPQNPTAGSVDLGALLGHRDHKEGDASTTTAPSTPPRLRFTSGVTTSQALASLDNLIAYYANLDRYIKVMTIKAEKHALARTEIESQGFPSLADSVTCLLQIATTLAQFWRLDAEPLSRYFTEKRLTNWMHIAGSPAKKPILGVIRKAEASLLTFALEHAKDIGASLDFVVQAFCEIVASKPKVELSQINALRDQINEAHLAAEGDYQKAKFTDTLNAFEALQKLLASSGNKEVYTVSGILAEYHLATVFVAAPYHDLLEKDAATIIDTLTVKSKEVVEANRSAILRDVEILAQAQPLGVAYQETILHHFSLAPLQSVIELSAGHNLKPLKYSTPQHLVEKLGTLWGMAVQMYALMDGADKQTFLKNYLLPLTIECAKILCSTIASYKVVSFMECFFSASKLKSPQQAAKAFWRIYIHYLSEETDNAADLEALESTLKQLRIDLTQSTPVSIAGSIQSITALELDSLALMARLHPQHDQTLKQHTDLSLMLPPMLTAHHLQLAQEINLVPKTSIFGTKTLSGLNLFLSGSH